MGGQTGIRTLYVSQADRRVFASFLDGYPLPSILPFLPFLSSRTGRRNNLKTIFTLCNYLIKKKDCNKLCKTFICLTVPANSSRMGRNDSSGKFIIKPCTIADEAGIGPARSQGSCGNIAKKTACLAHYPTCAGSSILTFAPSRAPGHKSLQTIGNKMCGRKRNRTSN